MRFADLHCHPTLFAFNRMRNTPDEEDPERFHPWNVPPSDAAKMAKGARATGYSQCDMRKMGAGNVRLAHCSLTPIEKGFFLGSEVRERNQPFALEALKLATGVTAMKSVVALAREGQQPALRELTGILRNRGPLRQALGAKVLSYAPARIRYLISDELDYWDELEREYAFLCARDGERAPDGVGYVVVRDVADFDACVADPHAIAVVLSIEGGHVFSIGPTLERLPDDTLFERIDRLRSWPHPILTLTLAHHFDNGLCGHARSMVSRLDLVVDQSPRLNEGFAEERDIGMRAARRLLGLADDLTDLDGRRIVLDCKHMSARTRRAYYEQIVRPYNARADRRRPPIPVVHTHIGYNAVASLDQLIESLDQENDHWHLDGLNAWSINVCDEDVRLVHETRGLLGVCFDQRIAGVKPAEKVPPEHHGRVLARQVLAMVDVIMQDDRLADEDKRTVWDRICIGSDFDGVIHPLSEFATALSFQRFAQELTEILEEKRHTRMIDELGVDTLVEKVCWSNLAEFTRQQLVTASSTH